MKKLYRPSYCFARNFGAPCPIPCKTTGRNFTCKECVFRSKNDSYCNINMLKYSLSVYRNQLSKKN